MSSLMLAIKMILIRFVHSFIQLDLYYYCCYILRVCNKYFTVTVLLVFQCLPIMNKLLIAITEGRISSKEEDDYYDYDDDVKNNNNNNNNIHIWRTKKVHSIRAKMYNEQAISHLNSCVATWKVSGERLLNTRGK